MSHRTSIASEDAALDFRLRARERINQLRHRRAVVLGALGVPAYVGFIVALFAFPAHMGMVYGLSILALLLLIVVWAWFHERHRCPHCLHQISCLPSDEKATQRRLSAAIRFCPFCRGDLAEEVGS